MESALWIVIGLHIVVYLGIPGVVERDLMMSGGRILGESEAFNAGWLWLLSGIAMIGYGVVRSFVKRSENANNDESHNSNNSPGQVAPRVPEGLSVSDKDDQEKLD